LSDGDRDKNASSGAIVDKRVNERAAVWFIAIHLEVPESLSGTDAMSVSLRTDVKLFRGVGPENQCSLILYDF
jgi:hypothetical protein